MALFTTAFKKQKNFSLISGKELKSVYIMGKVGSKIPYKIWGTYPVYPIYWGIFSKII